MPLATIRGVVLAYEIVGSSGPLVAYMPGGRKPGADARPLAEAIAAQGYRVLLHDRRNCGASDVMIAGEDPEYDIWADDLAALLERLGLAPVAVGGASSGARTALRLALRHPQLAPALLLLRPTGGAFGCGLLAQSYYGQYIALAQRGGMAAVCASEHFAACIAARPQNRDRLMGMDVSAFVATMEAWRRYFIEGVDQPMLGASGETLRALRIPTLIVPGIDRTHPRAVGERLHALMPASELSIVIADEIDADSAPPSVWAAQDGALAARIVDFVGRQAGRSGVVRAAAR
jgi:pimeloyl-ACP methyl ester carboxylesterase